jgi:hypothetical protein
MDTTQRKNLFILFIAYQSDEIELYEEYLIYNFPGMVSSNGVSLGLFLGLSFYGQSITIVEWD